VEVACILDTRGAFRISVDGMPGMVLYFPLLLVSRPHDIVFELDANCWYLTSTSPPGCIIRQQAAGADTDGHQPVREVPVLRDNVSA
jgi:hypothetical protein